MARDRGGPALAGQMLDVPDAGRPHDTPSAVQMAGLGCTGTGPPTRWGGRHCSARRAAAPTCRRTPALALKYGPVRAGGRVHRRRGGLDLPRRGRGLRQPDLAGGRGRRAARVAGRFPRLRDDVFAGRPVTRSRGSPAALAAPSPRQLTPANPGRASRDPADWRGRERGSSPGAGNRSRGEQDEQAVRVPHGRDRHWPGRCRLDDAPGRPAETESSEACPAWPVRRRRMTGGRIRRAAARAAPRPGRHHRNS